MSGTDMARLHTIVEGRVQGVGFRAFVQSGATGLGLTGWVRNRWDGSVEVVAEGDMEMLEKLLVSIRRGPRSSYVSKADPQWESASGEFTSFRIRMTA